MPAAETRRAYSFSPGKAVVIGGQQRGGAFQHQQIELRLAAAGNLRGGGVVVEQGQLAEQGAVGGLRGDAEPGEGGFIQRMAEMMRGGHRRRGDIRGAAGHPLGDRNRGANIDPNLLAERRRIAPVAQQPVDHRPRQRAFIRPRRAVIHLDGAVPVNGAGDQLLAAEDPTLDEFPTGGGALRYGHVFTFYPLYFKLQDKVQVLLSCDLNYLGQSFRILSA